MIKGQKGLEKHKREIHGRENQPRLKCSVCQLSCVSKNTLLAHMKVHEDNDEKWYCEPCNSYYKSKKSMSEHTRNYHHQRECYCDICDKRFSNKNTMKNHLNIVHKTIGVGMYSCKACFKSYSSEKSLSSHYYLYHGDQNVWNCNICGKTTATKELLKRHVASQHESKALS